jgi:hypothetical protein
MVTVEEPHRSDEDVEHSSTRSPRFTQWLAFLVFSTITMGSSVEAKKKEPSYENLNVKESSKNWAVACSAITFVLTFIVVCMHLNSVSSLFIVGTKLEGFLCVVLVGFWAATVSTVTDESGIAMTSTGAVGNGNLYYFSWAGFVCSVTLLTSYLNSAFRVDVAGEIKARSARLSTWSAHLAVAMVVMGSAASIYDRKCNSGFSLSNTFCDRNLFALVLGCLSAFASLVIIGMKIVTSAAPFMLEGSLAFVFLVCYGIEVALVTSPQGPGAPLGNLYYFSWGAFLSSFMLVASIVEDYNSAKQASSPEVNDEEIQDVQL